MFRSLYSFFVQWCRCLSWQRLTGTKHGICLFVQAAQAQELIFNLEMNALLALFLSSSLPLKPTNFSTHKLDQHCTKGVGLAGWHDSPPTRRTPIASLGVAIWSVQQYSPILPTIIEPEWSSDSCLHCHGLCTLNMNVQGEQSSKNQLDCSRCCFVNRKCRYAWAKSPPPSGTSLCVLIIFWDCMFSWEGGTQPSANIYNLASICLGIHLKWPPQTTCGTAHLWYHQHIFECSGFICGEKTWACAEVRAKSA